MNYAESLLWNKKFSKSRKLLSRIDTGKRR
ncbi:hypothetical protein [Aquimarina hainanensis]